MDIKISLATLSQLEAGKSYYLSNTTGTIKRTGLWQWFKCVTGFGDGRAKAQQLAQVVKESLLATAGISEDSTLAADIKRFDDAKYSIYGSALKEIAGRFKTAHADAIVKNDVRREAFQIANEVAEERVQDWVKGGYVGENLERPGECGNNLKKLALYAVQHMVKDAVDNRKVPEDLRREMSSEMQRVVYAISTAEIMQVMQRSGQGFPMVTPKRGIGFLRYDLDELHTRAVLAALMTKKGPVPPDVFVRNLALLQEDEVQNHKDALLKAPLGAPTELDSGSKFAELIMGAFKDGSTSAWESVAEPVSE